ncbi:CPBP family intramembrane glutamic endopeptidase [Clostridium frigidicarnis]|uniref:CAAX protease self-immunity n=1 Tax=Clostridium frigidicarnis TaxID=84698 RepID=A0A1I0YQU1_9CLOT|nr:CPBP family intramembrane glutamic endopeptidase [Clostridium frigidicarnis]SFB15327.1 CAAX protease self-immunity [Clostridium frigidicarnis]
MRESKLLKPLKFLSDIEHGNITFNLGIWGSIGVLILFLLFGDLLISLPLYIKKQTTFMIIVRVLLSLVLLIFVLWAASMVVGTKSENISNHNTPSKKIFVYFALLLIGYRLFFGGTISHILDLIPQSSIIEYLGESLENDTVFMMFTVIVIAPIKEEFLMRGIICNGLSKRYSNKVAILVSAFMFALIHLNIQQGVNAFLLGVILGYAYLKTKSLYLTIFLHMLNNTIVFPLSIQYVLGGAVQIVYSAIAAIIGLALIYKYYNKLKLSLDSKDVIVVEQNLQV